MMEVSGCIMTLLLVLIHGGGFWSSGCAKGRGQDRAVEVTAQQRQVASCNSEGESSRKLRAAHHKSGRVESSQVNNGGASLARSFPFVRSQPTNTNSLSSLGI